MTNIQQDNVLDGIDLKALGKAINKIRISEGIPAEQLASDARLNTHLLYGLASRDGVGSKTLIALVEALKDSTKLDIKTPQDVIDIAGSYPDVTDRTLLKRAIKTFCDRQAIKSCELEARSKALYVTIGENGKGVRPPDYQMEYYNAKVLGFSSLAEMLLAEQRLEAKIDDKTYTDAVDTWCHEMGIKIKTLCLDLGVSSIKNKYRFIPNSIRPKLTTMLGFASEQALIDAVANLEPVPDRVVYGQAVQILRTEQKTSIDKLASDLGCSGTVLGDIEHNVTRKFDNGYQSTPSSSWLRKIPPHFGCTTMQEVIEKARDKTVPKKDPVNNRNIQGVGEGQAVQSEGQKNSGNDLAACWVDIINQSGRRAAVRR